VPRGPYVAGGLSPSARGLAEADRVLAQAGLAGSGPLVVLHPGSGDNFPGRRWSASGFAAVGRLARARHGARVAVTGSAGEEALCRGVAQAVGPGAATVAGRTGLEGLIGVLFRARALVSNDTGPVHLASALARPVLALFGPNTPTLYGPLSPGSRAFFVGLPCSPCLTTDNYRSSRCRLHTCMAAIPTGEVATALDRLLAGAGSPEAACVPASS
jgi:ADP-heptose:LPS heptosyltransferase